MKYPGPRAVVKHKFTVTEVQSIEDDKTGSVVNHIEEIKDV